MEFITATQSNWFLIGQIAWVLGKLMNVIFEGLNAIGLPNIGVSIILFTLIIKALMIPLTIRQQKFSKLNAVMQPELNAIQKKYKDNKDQASVMKMSAEQKEVYAKYGTSPTGGCIQMLIQMPILFALYQVIYHMPGYISRLKDYYQGIADVLMKVEGWASNAELIELAQNSSVTKAAEKFAGSNAGNYVIDMMYNFTHDKWEKFFSIFSNNRAALEGAYNAVSGKIDQVNSFLGIDLTMTPTQQLWPAIFIPILAGVLQWLSTKLMPQPQQQNNENNPMAGMSGSMNIIFPIMSVVFCFMFSAGIGLYWVASSGIQVLVQIFVNRYIDRIDLNDMVKKNIEKANVKRVKRGQEPIKVTKISENVRSLEDDKKQEEDYKKEVARRAQESTEYYASHSTAKKGSLAEKAGMVQAYEERQRELKSGKKN